MTHKRMHKEDQYPIILKKLFMRDRLSRPDFEPVRKKARESTFIEQENNIVRKTNSIPHASIRLRLDELTKRHSVEYVHSDKKSKRGDFIPLYEITFLGLIELLSFSFGEKFSLEFWNKLRYHMPIHFHSIFDSLEKLLTKEYLCETFTLVCKNTNISVLYDPEPTEKSSNFSQYEFIKYYVGITFNHYTSTYSMADTITISDVKNKQDLADRKRRNAVFQIWKLIMCVFLHELMMDGLYFEESKRKLIIKNYSVLNIFKNDDIMREEYLKFLSRIDDILRIQSELKNDIRKHF